MLSSPNGPPLDPAPPSRKPKGLRSSGNALRNGGEPSENSGAPPDPYRPGEILGDRLPEDPVLPASSEEGNISPVDDADLVLAEIDRLRDELASHSSASAQGPARTAAPEWDESSLELEAQEPEAEVSSPYLEERLSIARSLASELAQEAGNVERGMQSLRKALETMDQELGKATEELEFVRSNGWERSAPPPVPVPKSVPRPNPGPRPAGPAGAGSYGEYTVSRYNLTVGELHARRRATLWVVVVLAAAISGALLFLTLKAHEPIPVVWLAVLPLVWMIPVPFFVFAFRGTHRVLRQHRFELPEEP